MSTYDISDRAALHTTHVASIAAASRSSFRRAELAALFTAYTAADSPANNGPLDIDAESAAFCRAHHSGPDHLPNRSLDMRADSTAQRYAV